MIRQLVAAAAVALLLVGCGAFTAPQQTPAALTDIVSALVLRNITITNQVAGDAGCSDSSLFGNAIRYDISPAGDTRSYPVFVFGWKSQSTFDASKAAFYACVDSYARTNNVSSWDVIDDYAPWRAYGPGWPIALRNAIGEALQEAAGSS